VSNVLKNDKINNNIGIETFGKAYGGNSISLGNETVSGGLAPKSALPRVAKQLVRTWCMDRQLEA
jgi:hypothetical protein